MKTKSLALLLLTACVASASVTTNIEVEGYRFPERIQNADWGYITNYAALNDAPELGVGIGYRGDGIKIDIYLYDSLKPEWSALSIHEKILKEKETISEIFDHMVKRGEYADVKITSHDAISAGGHEYQHVEIRYHDRKNGDLKSHYYLSDLNGKVLKIRISEQVDHNPPQAAAAFIDIAKSIAK